MAQQLRASGIQVDEWYADRVSVSKRFGFTRVFVVPFRIALQIWRERHTYDVALVHEPSAWPSAWLARMFPARMPRVFAVSHGVETRGKCEFRDAHARGVYAYGKLAQLKHLLFTNWQSNAGLRLAERVICLNTKDSEYLQQVLGRTPEVIIQINNGIDPDNELPDIGGRVRDPNRIVMLSQWRDYKGTRLLPNLWHTVVQACPQAQLYLIGTGAPEPEVRSAFHADVQSSLTIIPAVHDRELMQNMLTSASIFLMPSIFEGSPLAMIEAMACGLAVVGSDAGGIPDLLGHGEYGLIFPWRQPEICAAHLIDLLQHRDDREHFAAAARQRAATLTWAAAAAPVISALQERHRIQPLASV